MSQKESIHFKDEIRNSFITYALIPAILFSVVVIVVASIIWNWRIYHHTADENTYITSFFNQTISRYNDYCEQFAVHTINQKRDLSNVYGLLKNFTLKQKWEADFVVLDKNYSVLLVGNSSRSFEIPSWQQESSWGVLGRMKINPQKVFIEASSNFNKEAKPEIVIGKSFFENEEVQCFLIFFLSPDTIETVLNPKLPFAICNSYGHLLFSTDSRYKNQLNEIPLDYRNTKSYFKTGNEAVFHQKCGFWSFEVYNFSDISLVYAAFILLFFMIMIFLLLLIFGLFSSAKKISEEKSRNVDKIVAACESFSNGNFKGHLQIQSNIEFEKIAIAFNEMFDNVHNLIEENRHEVQEKYNAELKKLEMQFNPHFIFNTLETIKFLIKLDPDKAQKTILSLSELLRYSISNEVSVVPIREDIHYIENYLNILQLRFGNRFNYSIDIPETLYDCMIPKLILQPLIGNSVKYGFENIEVMTILISARAVSGKLTIAVHDNGSGISKETLKSIRSLLKNEQNTTSHTGLHTAQRRIQLMYGTSYGVKIDSSPENGTRAKITMPVKK